MPQICVFEVYAFCRRLISFDGTAMFLHISKRIAVQCGGKGRGMPRCWAAMGRNAMN